MNPDQLIFPAAFYGGCIYYFERSDCWSASYFGGPSSVTRNGLSFGPRPLHHVVTIGSKDVPADGFILSLPLLYGMCFSGCSLRYRVVSATAIEVLEMEPTTSSEDWPYPMYPAYLPYVPLRIAKAERCDISEFTKLSCQPDRKFDDTSLIVIVPASPVLGVSLWGADGDAEGVQVVFEFDSRTKIVSASNQCY